MKNMRMKLLALTLAIAMTAGILPANGCQTVKAKSGTVKKVMVTNVPGKKLTLQKGQTFALKTRVIVTKGSKKLIYKSSNKKVASVNKKGVIKAKKAGTAGISVAAKADKKKKTVIKVIVTDKVKVQKIKLNATEVTLSIGMDDEDDWDYEDDYDYDDDSEYDYDDDYDDTEDYDDEYQLTAAVSPANATNKALTWSSSDEDVVEVSKYGFLIAIGEGEAVVKARAKDGSGVSASCHVTVIDDSDDGDDMDADEDSDEDYDDDVYDDEDPDDVYDDDEDYDDFED